MKTIAVLGGTHFIGHHLVNALHAQGHQITIFNRGITVPPSPLPEGIKQINGNRNNYTDYKRLFCDEFDVVFDLSGYNTSHIEPIVQNYKSKIGHYIFCSTSCVYQTQTRNPINEGSLRIFKKNTYGGEKALAEELLLHEFTTHNFPITIFRPHAVFGPYDKGIPTHQACIIFHKLSHSLQIAVLAEGKVLVNFLYVKDLVNSFILAMNTKEAYGEVYGIAGDEIKSELEFFNLCGKVCFHKPIVHFVENLAPEDAHLVRHCRTPPHVVIDNAKVKNELGLKFTPLKLALEQTYSWFEQNPKHFGPPPSRGEHYFLNNRPIPTYIKFFWKKTDKIIKWLRKRAPKLIRKVGLLFPISQ